LPINQTFQEVLNMKPRSLIVLKLIAGLTCGAAYAVQAQEATPAPEIEGFKSQLTRAQVVQQTMAAKRAWGLALPNDYDAERRASAAFRPGYSRAQIAAEAAAANALGLTRVGEAGAPEATPAQLQMIREAGLRAIQKNAVARVSAGPQGADCEPTPR
jgi:Domain of unknown function (DUF4148)